MRPTRHVDGNRMPIVPLPIAQCPCPCPFPTVVPWVDISHAANVMSQPSHAREMGPRQPGPEITVGLDVPLCDFRPAGDQTKRRAKPSASAYRRAGIVPPTPLIPRWSVQFQRRPWAGPCVCRRIRRDARAADLHLPLPPSYPLRPSFRLLSSSTVAR